MIYECPQCQRKNNVPDASTRTGEVFCGACKSLITTILAEQTGSVLRNVQTPRTPIPQKPSVFPNQIYIAYHQCHVLYYNWIASIKSASTLLKVLNALYLLLILIISVSNAVGPEYWGPGSVNLYIPQGIWLIPGLIILAANYRSGRSLMPFSVLLLLWTFGPIMGFSAHWSPGFSHQKLLQDAGGLPLRLMTYNVKWGKYDGNIIAQDIRKYNPDILQLQDSGDILSTETGQYLRNWNVVRRGQFVIASRFPITDLRECEIPYQGERHEYIRSVIQVGLTQLIVYNIHLLTPRFGLIAVRHHQESGLVSNVDDRLSQAHVIASNINSETDPLIITGDLNAPIQSLVCRALFDTGLRDAFSEVGFGYGYTYGQFTRVGRPYVRIDHIMTSRQWQTTGCWVGNSRGSEHCPVIADVVLPYAYTGNAPS